VKQGLAAERRRRKAKQKEDRHMPAHNLTPYYTTTEKEPIMASPALAKPRVWIIDDQPPNPFTTPFEDVKLRIQLILDENQELQARLTALENLALENLAAKAETPRPQPDPVEDRDQAKSQGHAISPAMSGLEVELRQDLAWLDLPCPFKKAGGRTWRQMGENYGDKIPMNGRGAQVPRAYLHSIESWQEAKLETRLKSKIALEIGSQA
jgi:hypothetical protein